MDLLTKLRGLTYLGLRTLLRTVTYSLSRDAIERRHGSRRPTPPDAPVGEVREAVRTARGAIFRFDAAELEVVFLAPDLARFTWTPGALPVPYAIAKDDWTAVEPAWTARDGAWEVSTADLHVTVARDGSVTLRSGGRVLREDLPPVRRGDGWAHRSRPRADARHFGLGERACPFDLTGGTFRLWNSEAEGAYGPQKDPLYLCVPVWLTVHGDGSMLTFFEDPSRGRVTFRDPVEASFDGGALRYYAIPGPADRALDRYTELTGRPSMPPRWALLFHQSRWSYMDEAEVREVADGFASRGLPLSAIHLDIHYMDGHRVFTVDPRRFPDMAGLARDLDAKGVKLVAILDPGVKVDPAYDAYREVVGRKAACTLPDGRPATALVWPGTCVFPDFTAPAAREWWAERYRFFAENGLAGAWHDMNEPAAFAAWGDPTLPLAVRHSMEGRGGDHVEAHNLYALLEARAGYEGLMRNRPDRRPWILSRSGWAGLQRWAWNWTGDSESDWWTLAQTVRMVMALGLSGVPYTGADVGGFGGG
ncbi:MAG: alpha-glucosidase, partial [Deltaproteobacteria bacterium]|nr:alpha-glucosidase [Deltaproteobacteria bacterium]